MKLKKLAIFLLVINTPTFVRAAIFGNDDRLDVTEVKDPGVLSVADATVSFFWHDNVSVSSDGREGYLKTTSFGATYQLCSDEPFANQGTGSQFSGFLVQPDVVLTAGHAITKDEDCQNYLIVFGYNLAMPRFGVVPTKDIYRCKKIISRDESNSVDFALIQLDRLVLDRAPLKVNSSGRLRIGTPLLVFGHPSGLPLKITGWAGAKVERFSHGSFFLSNTNTFGGNSGGPVINRDTGLVEGLFIGSDVPDYTWFNDESCNRAAHCQPDTCEGEEILKISRIWPWLRRLH